MKNEDMNLSKRILKAIKVYDEMGFGQKEDMPEGISIDDIFDIQRVNLDESGKLDWLGAISDALKGAFILGYKTAKTEEKKK